MAKFNSGDILRILRKFGVAGDENVPRKRMRTSAPVLGRERDARGPLVGVGIWTKTALALAA